MNIDSNKGAREFLAAMEPELWHRCYPRIYEEPTSCGRYYSAKEVSGHVLATAIRARREGLGGETQTAEIIWASRMASLGVPLYWMGHDMGQAIQQTVPPITFDWSDANLPFDAMAFMMPKGLLRHEDARDGEATFVSFMRVRRTDEIRPLVPVGPQAIGIRDDSFTCFAAMSESDTFMHWTFAREYGLTHVNLANLDTLVQEFGTLNHTSYSPWSSSLNDADNRFMARVSHFVFGAILMMLTKPEYITEARVQKRTPAKAGRAAKEFWHPNVIGLHYRIRREWQGGTHASPRFHWVRGAYKEQPYGANRQLRRRIWVEPYMRGLKEGEMAL